MSDFVSRVAARAVGQAASAQPRLPALFEPSGPGAGALEVVDETLAAAPAASRLPASPTALEVGRALEHPVPAPAGPAPPSQPGPPAPAIPARPRHREAHGASDKVSLAPADDAAAESLVEPASAERGAAVAPTSPLAPVSAPPAAAAPAQPVARAAPVASPPPVAPPTAGAAEQRPVRVHIGRLEVRAALQETPVPQRARERPRPPELSLGDYLRGRRAGA